MIQKILNSRDPFLRQTAKPVTAFDQRVKSILQDLQDTLEVQKDPEGVGLAATQIGKNLQAFVVNYRGFKRVVVNPLVSAFKNQDQPAQTAKAGTQILEGCLSLPNYYGPLKRAAVVKIKYQTPAPDNLSLIAKEETFTGFHAQIVLHEIDHLNGVLFLDRLLEQKRPLYKLEGDQWEEVEI